MQELEVNGRLVRGNLQGPDLQQIKGSYWLKITIKDSDWLGLTIQGSDWSSVLTRGERMAPSLVCLWTALGKYSVRPSLTARAYKGEIRL